MDSFFSLIFILLLISILLPIIQRKMLLGRRLRLIEKFEKKRRSRLITLIHRQEALNLLGIPLVRYIDIDDSEQMLRAIRLTDEEVPIDVLLHTPGGLVLASEQIAFALLRHKAKVTVYIPHYAMSGGTLIAMAADEVVMDHDAVLGPVDPQIGDPFRGAYPAASVLAALKQKNPNRDDSTLILGNIAEKAIKQMTEKVYLLLSDKMSEAKAKKAATLLTTGKWTHDYAISPDHASEFGLNVRTGLPVEIYELMDLYPQAPKRPSVEYIPTPHLPREKRS